MRALVKPLFSAPRARVAAALAGSHLVAALAGASLLGGGSAAVAAPPWIVDRPAPAVPWPAPVASLPAEDVEVVPVTSPPETTAEPTTVPPQPAAAPEPEQAAPPAPSAAPRRGPVPSGKGMWIYLPEQAEGGDVHTIVARAKWAGLTHIYVRTGSSRMGFHGAAFLDVILPIAHANGIRVYGWDFPYLDDPGGDVKRAAQAITHTTPGGHRIDGFVADIETRSEGTNLSVDAVRAYGAWLREAMGPRYPLIVAVPRPSAPMLRIYPYTEVIEHFDAVAPMVYWLNRQPESDVAGAVEWLKQFGKPIIPVGQAYDGAPEGGRPGVPPRDELLRFMDFAERHGASGVSFWSWQHATAEAWHAIRDADQFRLRTVPVEAMRKGEVKAVETLLATSGFPVARIDGTWDQSTSDAVAEFQQASGIEPVTGGFGPKTRELLLRPFRAPLGPPPAHTPKPKPKPKPDPTPPAAEPDDETFVIAGES